MIRTTTKAAAAAIGSSPVGPRRSSSQSQSQSHSKELLEEVFLSLEDATRLDKSGCHRIEAATKYYESCYLMRQIIAGSTTTCDDSSTMTTTRHRLLEEKIDYYTKVAQRLYFDDTKSVNGRAPPPATSIIIGLLDDVVSVFTISHPLEKPHYPTTTLTTTLPQNRNNENNNDNDTEADYERLTGQSTALGTTRSNPSTLLQAINNVLPRGNNSNSNGQLLKKQQQRQRQYNQQHHQHQQQRRRRGSTTTFAKDAAERKIHIRMNLANAKLGQAIDLDEHYYYHSHDIGESCYERIIHSYVEASEFYLDAIRLAEGHQQNYPSQVIALSMSSKVDPWAMKVKSPSSSPSPLSASPISTVIPKLKHLLISALDRVETLKLKVMNMKMKEKKSMMTYSRSRSAKAIIGCGRYDRMKDTKSIARPSSSRLSL